MPKRECERTLNDQSLIERYTDQPASMPRELFEAVSRLNEGRRPLLYAMTDLDSGGQLASEWLVLGNKELFLFSDRAARKPERIERRQIRKVREVPGLSSSVLVFLGDDPAKPLLEVRYSRRQKQAVENIRFVLEEELQGHPVLPEHPDKVYAESVSGKIKDAQSSVAVGKLHVILRLMGYFKPYRWKVTVGFIAALLMTLLNLIPPYLTGYIVDEILNPLDEGVLAVEEAMKAAFVIVGGLALLYLLREVSAFIRLRHLAHLGENVAHDLRRDLYRHIQKLSLSFFSKKQTGSIISRVSSDTDRLWDFIAFGIVEATLSVVMLTGLGLVLIGMDWQLGLVLVLPIPLFLAAFVHHGGLMKRHFLKAWRRWSDVTAVLSDTIPGMRVVKAFSQEGHETRRFSERNDKALVSFNEVHDVWTTFWPVLMFSFHLVTLLVWGLALPRVIGAWGDPLTIGKFVSFLIYMGMFFYPLEVIGQVTRMLNRAVSSAHRVFEIMDTEPDASLAHEKRKVDRLAGDVVFENVSFSYDGVRDSLRNVSFSIQKGEMIGLVGPSGAGKSTITNLVAGFHMATGGRVLVDGEDIRELDVSSYRRHIGMVLQEPFLFHGTLLENIRYGHHDAPLEQVVAAARAANAHDFICRLPLGYDTVVGERGHTLSGGERQRVSIARAILHNPRLLILDEATSNVDTETERKIQDALNRLIAGRTVIAIAHRLSTLKQADRLLVMKEGRLVEEGTHQKLLEMENGLYRKLHDMQVELHEQFAV